jgi:Ca2+-binding RTX toxin-like protein
MTILNQDKFDQQVLDLINAERTKAGLKSLILVEELDTASDRYAERLATGDFFDHTDPSNGSKPWDRAAAEGYDQWSTVGENIAAGYTTAESVVAGWLSSPGHRANILNASFTHTGIGYYYLANDTGRSNYNRYWVQVFGAGDPTPGNYKPETDSEELSTIFSSSTYTLEANIQNLTLTGTLNINGTGNSLGNIITGNSGNNALTGGGGNDSLYGDAGNDSYLFDADLVLGRDTLTDTSGVDTLNFARTSTKAVNVDLRNTAAQVVTEGNLTLTLTNATAFENIIGGSLGDSLTGNTLNNVLTGGGGNDSLNGGAGNDTYLFDTDLVLGRDTLTDTSGVDTLNFARTSTKAVNVDLSNTAAQVVTEGNLTLTLTNATTFENIIGGSLGDRLTGNTLNNVLTGGAGNDILTGGYGNDTLNGGTGLDKFVFNSTSQGMDTISDFVVADDTIQVSAAGFGGGLLAGAAIAANQFVIGSTSVNPSSRFIYNSVTGALFFDQDGSGSGIAQIQLAQLSKGLALTNADIFVGA